MGIGASAEGKFSAKQVKIITKGFLKYAHSGQLDRTGFIKAFEDVISQLEVSKDLLPEE